MSSEVAPATEFRTVQHDYHAYCARKRLVNEIDALLRLQERFQTPVYPVIAQLIAFEGRKVVAEPPIPAWKPFQWPESGIVRTTGDKFDVVGP